MTVTSPFCHNACNAILISKKVFTATSAGKSEPQSKFLAESRPRRNNGWEALH